ncbi:hypothetical protein [Metabacillus fastidiosus]|nr:hypothetical protein [Metabacillus fastidiosus]
MNDNIIEILLEKVKLLQFKKITAPKWNRNLSSYFTVFKGTITLL